MEIPKTSLWDDVRWTFMFIATLFLIFCGSLPFLLGISLKKDREVNTFSYCDSAKGAPRSWNVNDYKG